jgi:hypothetical protein
VHTVVIAACWYCYFVEYRDLGHLGEIGQLKPGTEAALGNLQRLIADLVRRGKRVYIVLHAPIGQAFDPRHMIRRSVLAPGFSAEAPAVDKNAILSAVDPIVSRLRRIAHDRGASVIDPMESLCDRTTCPVVSPDGEPMYHDAAHLRPSYVRNNVRFLDAIVFDNNASLTSADRRLSE